MVTGVEAFMLLNAGGTSDTLASSANPSVVGQPVTFTVSVVRNLKKGPCPCTPAGGVTFNDGGTALATVPLNAGAATLTTSTLSLGSHTITATYSGDANFNPNTSRHSPRRSELLL